MLHKINVIYAGAYRDLLQYSEAYITYIFICNIEVNYRYIMITNSLKFLCSGTKLSCFPALVFFTRVCWLLFGRHDWWQSNLTKIYLGEIFLWRILTFNFCRVKYFNNSNLLLYDKHHYHYYTEQLSNVMLMFLWCTGPKYI